MPASTGTHWSKWVSQRGVMRFICGVVFVALASCLAATSPNAVCRSGSFAIVSPNLEDHSSCGAGALLRRNLRLKRIILQVQRTITQVAAIAINVVFVTSHLIKFFSRRHE